MKFIRKKKKLIEKENEKQYLDKVPIDYLETGGYWRPPVLSC